FRTDDPWKAVTAVNLNSRQVHMQNFGSWLAIKSGAAGTYSRAVQVRVNNANRAMSGAGMFGSYAANEVYGEDWADRHIPFDSGGNLYRVVRDLRPPNFNYRGPGQNSYTNTYFKETNVTEDDWSDLIGMLRIMGENSGALFTPENVRQVVDVEQWMTHLAVMNLLANGESGLNTGNNDDYFLYRGLADRRFILLFHDLDQILGQPGSLAQNVDIFRGACCPISGDTEGSWRAMTRFLHSPDFEPLYLATLQRLLETTFSKPQFDALIDQVLGSYVPQTTINAGKTWMDGRRNYVRSQLPATPLARSVPLAVVSGSPRSPTPRTSATLNVGGAGITHYRFSLNGGAFGSEMLVDTPIAISNLANGTNTVAVIGRNASGLYQDANNATFVSWIVNTAWPAVRLNEVIASRSGQLRDQIELFNESAAAVNLAGLRLTDDLTKPNSFTFGSASLAPGAFLVLDSAQLGFSFDAAGDGVYLLHSLAAGGALLDSVEFGSQIADLSFGRVGESGDWQLTQPTFGSANVIEPVGDRRQIRINEWLASGVSPYPDDFVELYNPESRPVSLGGCYLTDQPIGAPTRSRIAPLSFIPAKGFAMFVPGNGKQANEFNFGLDPDQGEIALLAPDRSLIDSVVYGPQRTGVSTGRCPDGDAALRPLEAPTPGGPNQCPFVAPPPQTITLVPYNHVWKYEASGTDLGTAWINTSYDDSAWNSGPGLLGVETNPLPEPLRTTLPSVRNTTYYFRTQFNLDPALAAASIQVSHWVDDGAAFYLNGREVARYNLAAGATYPTFAAANLGDAVLRVFTLPADQLRPGANLLAVEVHQINATSSDVVFGLKMDALIVTNTAAQSGVLINEVLANNATLAEPDGSRPDWIELFNPSAGGVDLAGMSLTDTAANPRRWIFPDGSIIPAKGFLKVRFDAAAATSSSNTGFGLNANGGAVFLFNRVADGGGLQSAATYGLQPADWSIGRVPDGATNWTLTVPTLGAANRAATLGNPRLLKINEWMADPASGGDWLEIFNPGPDPVEISRLWLSDNLADPMKHLLPPLSFIGQGPYGFQKFEADEQPDAGADHVNFKLSASGESLALSTANGVLIDGLSFGPQLKNVSEGRLPDGAASFVSFAASPTPGSGNFLPLGNVVINELLSHSDPPLMDAVELHNPSASAVDISGWVLSDSAFNLRKFQIPAGTVIAPGGFVVFYEDQFNSPGGAKEPFSFSSAKGDEVFLSQAINGVLTGYRASAAFGPAENGISFGRFQTSQGFHFAPMAQRTFGKDNPATTNEFKLGTGAANSFAKVGPVVISEILYHPANTNAALEFIELHNLGAVAVPLSDPANPAHTWRLRKGIDFDFPLGTAIPAGGYLVIVGFDPRSDLTALSDFRSAYGAGAVLAGPYQGKLNGGGETIELQRPDPPQTLPGPDFGLVPYIAVDRIDYADASPWPASADGGGHSLQKLSPSLYGNDPASWLAAPPNPGAGLADPGDSDHDGLPGDWEIAHGLNPNDPSDAAADSDGDGLSNRQEYLAGTNPRDAASVFRAAARSNSSGELTLEFTAAPNRSYAIEFRDSLASGIWQKLADISSAPSERVMKMPINTGGSSAFFRVVLYP
ncbi:MAG: lamin tail domain-containing protein, partial [Verrucomicrobia bacterium]|nr:lamin tail domain-containing protein [Verrucomicrobiota bacterium]